jgi:gliding motility-associated-like protein
VGRIDQGERLEYDMPDGRLVQRGNVYTLVLDMKDRLGYEAFMASMRYVYEGCRIEEGRRTVRMEVFDGGLVSEAICEIEITGTIAYAGQDTIITVCPEDGEVPLPTVLDTCISPGGTWEPTLSNPGYFDPLRDGPGVYRYVVGSDECGSDTARYEIWLEEVELLEEDTLWLCDSVLVRSELEGGGLVWSTGAVGDSLWVFESGVYEVAWISVDGCVYRDSVYVLDEDILPIEQEDLTVRRNEAVTISPRIDPEAVEVFFVVEGDTVYGEVLTRTFSENTRVTVCQELGSGCQDCVMFEVTIEGGKVFMPNVFSPNGDNINDGFGPNFSGGDQDYRLSIYSRWGELIYDCQGEGCTWDGSYEGEVLDPAVFIYVMEYEEDGNPVVLKGSVTLVR